MQFIQFFCMNVAEQLLELHRPLRIRNTGRQPSTSMPSNTNPLRLVGRLVHSINLYVHTCCPARHFPSPIPQTVLGGASTRRCHVCKHTQHSKQNRRDTKCMCIECNVPLCITPCFRNFHTKNNISMYLYCVCTLYGL